ncbi:MAG: BlaI/MecI/CopY family transcriptional regulator [bacterium]
MVKRSMDRLGRRQKAVMEIVWELGEATVHDVRDRLNRDLAYTTVLSTMQQLEKSGWLRHRFEGRMNVYQPTRTREQVGSQSLLEFTTRVFGGDPLLLFQHLLENEKLTQGDLARLKKMIDQREKEQRDG